MERSGSQKFLLVVSVINIVFAVLGIIGGMMGISGGALFGMADSAKITNALAQSGVTQSQASGIFVYISLIVLVASVIQLVVGILGVRAANDNQKIMPVWVLSLIDVIGYAISLVVVIFNGSFGANGLTMILSLVLAGLLFWVANNIKKEAGK